MATDARRATDDTTMSFFLLPADIEMARKRRGAPTVRARTRAIAPRFNACPNWPSQQPVPSEIRRAVRQQWLRQRQLPATTRFYA